MAMDSFYEDTLYPLQDKVLALVDSMKLPFYLTGGTALSRGYFNHRYSDDLDFFTNKYPDFGLTVAKITSELKKHFQIEENIRAESYVSLKVESLLKVDFVNDVSYRYGKDVKMDLYSKVDNLENILSNKISALVNRDELKDVVDINGL